MTIIPIRRPRYTRGSILQLVQQVANEIAAENHGKVPNVFLMDIRLKEAFATHPDLVNLDMLARHCRHFWERANNKIISAGANIFVPGAYVTLGKGIRGRMDSLDPIAEVTLWMNKDTEITENFLKTMGRRRAYQLERIAEGTLHPDCKSLGALEGKLHGYAPKPDDDMPFSEESEDE